MYTAHCREKQTIPLLRDVCCGTAKQILVGKGQGLLHAVFKDMVTALMVLQLSVQSGKELKYCENTVPQHWSAPRSANVITSSISRPSGLLCGSNHLLVILKC